MIIKELYLIKTLGFDSNHADNVGGVLLASLVFVFSFAAESPLRTPDFKRNGSNHKMELGRLVR